MSKTFTVGDLVQLKPAVADSMMGRRKVVRSTRGHTFTWRDRRGHVVWISAKKDTVGVRWTDRPSVDPLPPGALTLSTD